MVSKQAQTVIFFQILEQAHMQSIVDVVDEHNVLTS